MQLPSDEKLKIFEQRRFMSDRENLNKVAERYISFLDDYLFKSEDIDQFREIFPREGVDIDLETVKVWLLLMRKENKDDISKVLAFLTPADYGWKKRKYVCSNPCFKNGFSCKSKYYIRDVKTAKSSLKAIHDIFFNEEYGGITLMILSYCLASLFSSRIKQSATPLYLQIACDRNTALYSLIREIVTVCDINTGFWEECNNHNLWSCNYDIKTIYPAQDIGRSLKLLSYNRDVPVIVDGHDNLRNYHALLREVANRPNKKNIDERGETFPIFICPSIRFSPKNIFSMNLTNLIVSEDYLALFKENKKMLTSLVLCLVLDFVECLFPEDGTDDDRKAKYTDDIFPFSRDIARHIKYIYDVYSLANKTAKNIGILSFFFTGFMRALSRAIDRNHIPAERQFAYSGQYKMRTVSHHIASLVKEAERLFIKVDSQYCPAPIDSISVNITGETDPARKKQIEKRARKHAIGIVGCYQSYGVSISITKIVVRGDLYIFDIALSEGERRHKVFKEAENVRVSASIKLEYFRPTTQGTSLFIAASEKPLKENSLIKIMEDPLFMNSKLKIPFAIGYDIMGDMVVEDLADIRHMLIGGSTGSGKSTALHSLLLSIVCKQSVDDVNLLIFDFGITYLSHFRKAPHLSHPIIYDKDVGVFVVIKLYEEMERRRSVYQKNPDDRSEFNKLPDIFCVIDEFPDFIRHGSDKKKKRELQETVTGLLEKGRGLKIHMVLAAQDPTEENMKCGVTNLGTCLAFKCVRKHNSIVMLNETGAENLAGKGDMLYKSESNPGIKSIRGAYIDEKSIASRLETHMCVAGNGKYKFEIEDLEAEHNAIQEARDESKCNSGKLSDAESFDKNLADIIMLLFEQRQISNDQIQLELEIAYRKANSYMERLEEYKLIPPLNGKRKPRKLIPESLNELSAKVIEFLELHGYARDDIIQALDNSTNT